MVSAYVQRQGQIQELKAQLTNVEQAGQWERGEELLKEAYALAGQDIELKRAIQLSIKGLHTRLSVRLDSIERALGNGQVPQAEKLAEHLPVDGSLFPVLWPPELSAQAVRP